MSKMSYQAVVLSLAMAFGMVSCVAAEPGTERDRIAVTQESGAREAAQVAGDQAIVDSSGASTAVNTPSLLIQPTMPFGCPVPVEDDDAFGACLVSCRNAGNPPIPCRRGCCSTFTGCTACYQQ